MNDIRQRCSKITLKLMKRIILKRKGKSMKITKVDYYCDICKRKMDFHRFVRLRKKFTINAWGITYDVCEDCFKSIASHINELRKGETDGKET